MPGIEGDPGTDGADGTNGINAYTLTTADFDTPTVGNTVAITVAQNGWAVVGQVIFIEGAGFYEVTIKTGSTGLTVENLGYEVNTTSGVTISSGSGVSPGGPQPDVSGFAESGANSDIESLSGLTTPLSVSQGGTGRASAVTPLEAYGSGTAYTMTTTPAALNFGTNDPQITFVSDGLYMIIPRVRLDYVGATYAANQVASFKLRRTNNTPADIANGASAYILSIVTTNSRTADSQTLPVVFYQATAGDILTIFGSVDALPSAGSMQVTEAELVAVWIKA